MQFIKPENEEDRPRFLYYLGTSGTAVGVSGDGIFTVTESTISILREHHLKFIEVSDPQKPTNPS